MQQLLYVSVARNALESQAILGLVAHARLRNRRSGVTGTLIGSRRHFVQLLEGTRTDLEKIYGAVRADARHRAVLQLGRREAKERLLPGEDMGFDWCDSEAGEASLSAVIPRLLEAIEDERVRGSIARFARADLLP